MAWKQGQIVAAVLSRVPSSAYLDEAEGGAGHLPAGAGEEQQHVAQDHLSQILRSDYFIVEMALLNRYAKWP